MNGAKQTSKPTCQLTFEPSDISPSSYQRPLRSSISIRTPSQAASHIDDGSSHTPIYRATSFSPCFSADSTAAASLSPIRIRWNEPCLRRTGFETTERFMDLSSRPEKPHAASRDTGASCHTFSVRRMLSRHAQLRE